jgi:hypothetical protein
MLMKCVDIGRSLAKKKKKEVVKINVLLTDNYQLHLEV